jgi:predicted DNA-binding transcriptional regulator AlpA
MVDSNTRDDESLLNESETAKFLAVSVRTLQAWRTRELGPPFVRLGRAIRYRLKDLIEWVRSKTCLPKA